MRFCCSSFGAFERFLVSPLPSASQYSCQPATRSPVKGARDGIADWFRDHFVHFAADLSNMTMFCQKRCIDSAPPR
jgi:hypothetical protein